jgi:hypothetical protein
MIRVLIRSAWLLAAIATHPMAAGLTKLYTFTGAADGATLGTGLVPFMGPQTMVACGKTGITANPKIAASCSG